MQTDSGDPSSVPNVQQRYENLFFLKEVCARFLKEAILRLPFLLTAIHHDNVEFPDADVVDFFTYPLIFISLLVPVMNGVTQHLDEKK